MTTYTHDGITVTRSKDGRLYFSGEGIRSTFFAANEAAAIHAAYLASLGLTLWEHDGEQWLIPLEGGEADARCVMRISNHSALWADHVLPPADRFDRALVSYLAAHTPPARPKPGERWLLDMDGSVEQEVEVVEIGGERYFAWQDGDTTPALERVADRHPSSYRRAES